MSHAVDAYEVYQRERGLSGATIARARGHLERLLELEACGGRSLSALTGKYIAARYGALVREQAVDTHRNALRAGKAFGAWCVAKRWITRNPFADVTPLGRRARGKPQHHRDEARRLLEACLAENSRASLAVACALVFGLRASEIAGKQCRDLDDDGRLLWTDKGKTHNARRFLEVPELVRAQLLELARGRAGASYLFGASETDRPRRFWVHYHCRRMCKVAGVPVIPPHGLRGTHATLATSAGQTSHAVAAQLGHGSTAITEAAYIAPGAVERAKQRTVLGVIQGGRP